MPLTASQEFQVYDLYFVILEAQMNPSRRRAFALAGPPTPVDRVSYSTIHLS